MVRLKLPLICLVRRPSTAKRLQPIFLSSSETFWCVVLLIIIQLLKVEYN